jgi:hypothetical protein
MSAPDVSDNRRARLLSATDVHGQVGCGELRKRPDELAPSPVLNRAIDSVYYLHTDDVAEPLELRGARLRVPTGPGLGVSVDEDEVAHYAAVSACEGDLTG